MRLAVPRTAGLVLLVLLAGYVFWGAPQLVRLPPILDHSRAASAVSPILLPQGPLVPQACETFLGIMTAEGVHDLTGVDTFAARTDYSPRVYQYAQGWEADTIDSAHLSAVARMGMLPIVTWEPWDYSVEPDEDALRGYQPKYRLSRIIDGAFDDYIRSWARGVREFHYTIALRFAHEMNGYWYPWAEQANGNHRGEYVLAWRHVHDIFEAEGATNVVWLWSPNVSYANSTPLAQLYPGDDYVDWIGFSGYYGTLGLERYRSFDEIFDPSIEEVSQFTHKPIVIAETGATDQDGRKAEWITQMFESLPHHPEIIGVIWFEGRQEQDWRVSTSAPAAAAFAEGAAAPRYQIDWPRWTGEPRTPTGPCP